LKSVVLLWTGLLMIPPALAQVSASSKLEEMTFCAASHPDSGAMLAAPSFRIRLDTVGEPWSSTTLSSASFRVEAGFSTAYPPPGEVRDLVFTGGTGLGWAPERSVGAYDLYRGWLDDLPALGYGTCEQPGLPEDWTSDLDAPPPGAGFFYLVTAVNRLGEKGTKGFDSQGRERGNDDPCP
jgi:hypothetical protein